MTVKNIYQPLATRMRPTVLDEFVGQTHLLGNGKPLKEALAKGNLHSMILWGPPGTGKTTLAHLMAGQANFKSLSAVLSGVKEIRELVKEATRPLVLFVDEVHRFNKAQQDLFLPYIENGTFIFIGATTENPSFELNNALLSRLRVYVLKKLNENEMLEILQRALKDKNKGVGNIDINFPINLQKILVSACDGDSRKLLNCLEILIDFDGDNKPFIVTNKILKEVLTTNLRNFDKHGDIFYDQISALHKSVRGSAPDAALYWLCRMLDGGCDPRYIARRMIRMACEDIALADPRALEISLNAAQTYERLGSPEGELALAQAVLYLASCSKSNACYQAFNEAMEFVKNNGTSPVPIHLRNAPTKLMKNLCFGKNYKYAHNEKDAYVAGENYFPDDIINKKFYYPVDRGLEAKIKAKLDKLELLDKLAENEKT